MNLALCSIRFEHESVINRDEQLHAWLPRLQAAEWIALDTEADSLHAYPEKVCLIQFSIPGEDVLVDPLAGVHLAPLFEILGGRELMLHGADYDLRLLYRGYQFRPHKIFDTMIAARLLGCLEFGLNNLLNRFLGVTLEKGSQKADWARRPLTLKMEAYAHNDTRYLQPLVAMLRAELIQKNRLSWLEETCARLVADCSQPRVEDPDSVWRVKGSHHLDRRELAVLREIWQWRETEAIAANRPPYFVLSHEKMVDLARASTGPHQHRLHLPHHLNSRRRNSLLHAVEKGLALPPAELPLIPRSDGRRASQSELRRMDSLKQRRDQRAAELGIDPTLIASRATLLLLAHDWEAHAGGLMSWQRQLLEPDP